MIIKNLLATTQIIPVITLDNEHHAIPLAKALIAGGLRVLEITLRTDAGLKAISAISQAGLDCIVGAGTITNPAQIIAAKKAGAQFIVTPGSTAKLLEAAAKLSIPLIPGVMTPSEILLAKQYDYQFLKCFPTGIAGGAKILNYFAELFPDVVFCPTGGIQLNNMSDYLSLPNVHCIGGTWLTPKSLLDSENWAAITRLAEEAVMTAKFINSHPKK